jgi:hypothetical protein
MYRVERHVGRLVEIRIWSPVSIEEAVVWGRDHDAVVASVGGPYVCLVDLVGAAVFPPDVVARYVETMKSEQQLLRTATLLSPSPTLGLQIQRMIREANHPERRAFRDPRELEQWLGEVLDGGERARLATLLAERRSLPPPPSR